MINGTKEVTGLEVKEHGNNHREVRLSNGNLHVFANDEVFANIESNVYGMAENNLAIPRVEYMSYTPDVHVGVGTCIGTTAVWNVNDGFISPSIVGNDIGCGMRVHKTNIHKDDIKDKKTRRAMIHAIEKYVNTQDQSAKKPISGYFADSIDLDQVVYNGIEGLPDEFKNIAGWHNVETTKFEFNGNDLEHISDKIKFHGRGQIGTLGGGNHFIEIQSLTLNKENEEIARKWGLFDGQVVVMIHSGSRAWGGMLGNLYTRAFKKVMEKWGVTNPDPNLVYAPLDTNEGQMYLNLMYSALNYAIVNRHMMGFAVNQAFDDMFGKDVKTEVLYDLMHNYALKEPHHNKVHLVHRKGATRALPAGHFMNINAYKETGHPALIPGSMGTSSYIMVGKEEGDKNFYSICHGAGRLRSRSATKELVTVDEFASAMKVGQDDEILINQRMLESVLDESPQAYKDVDQIIDSVVGANLAEVVAQCNPMAVIKGV